MRAYGIEMTESRSGKLDLERFLKDFKAEYDDFKVQYEEDEVQEDEIILDFIWDSIAEMGEDIFDYVHEDVYGDPPDFDVFVTT